MIKISDKLNAIRNRLRRKFQLNNNVSYYEISDEEYNTYIKNGKKIILCVTVGRSGTRWLADIFSAHKNAIGSCERRREIESFYRYVKWNNLPVDVTGIIDLIKFDIVQDWKKHDVSLVVTPYFSHDLFNLSKLLKVDSVIWGINDAKFTITSFLNKNWYGSELPRKDHLKISGFQPALGLKLNYSFGRPIPSGQEFEKWKLLTRVGKVSWFFNIVNMEIYNSIKKMDKAKVWIFKLSDADQNFEYYLKMAGHFNLEPVLSKKEFLAIKGNSRHLKDEENTTRSWSEIENKEFENYTNEFSKIYSVLK